ncbi:FprA family A-type flavoprotein [uncultured Bacteroides sp.]|uniref:FprA family A-type flavoprotein n=1 Tax=uncultured Bacteroides sp. TaxID=162156 RepID=UPI002AA87D28|nr:FprA family A-type flavoprotein [uncultured Bacteroides sp.]
MEQKTKIKGKVHYVGVNDRTKALFEGLWPLPYGVSYNSYLIDDEKIALVDTVDICYFEVFLHKIRSVIGDRPIDYLIINHMEPDHSGSLSLIKQYYPNITIVGNKQTFGMVEGFYGITGEQLLIKNADPLDLGYHKLRFYLTPMVHWPETMMTFDETEGIIFSGDGFGAFGTLDGGFIDTRMNTDIFWEEMIRYYSNIVGKYGSAVQKALEKLAPLNITTICSTHGPVWTEQRGKVIDLYDRLSRYEGEEGVVIVYGTMYGNTEQMAEAIALELSAQGIKNIVLHNVNKSHSSYIISDIFKYKGLIIGSATYCNELYPEIGSLLPKILLRDMKNRYLGYFGSFCWSSAALRRMNEFAEKSKFEIVGEPVDMKISMDDLIYSQCENMGKAMADRLKQDRETSQD